MPNTPSILIVDDEDKLRYYLKKEFVRKGYRTEEAWDCAAALDALARNRIDVVLLDIYLPGENGVELLKRIRVEHPLARVIMLTGHATVETALESMKLGAYDYLTKPYNLTELCLLIERAFEEVRLRRENEVLQRRILREAQFEAFVGEDPGAQEALRLADKAAGVDSPVLVRGETGTGKEIVARRIHRMSARAAEPFVAINCAALQDSLLESELFGHEKGAFTDAVRQKYGLVELAHHGSLFLDEIGEMSLAIQAKLLRFLDSGEFRRLGGTRDLRSDVRILSATHRDLSAAVESGVFRRDLFFRLNVLTIWIPPLRERRGDIPRLAEHFVKKHAASLATRCARFAPEAIAALQAYRWPGNVRELENAVERAMILCDGDVLRVNDVEASLAPDADAAGAPRDESLAELERCHILRVLARAESNKAKAARLLGIDVKTLYNKLRLYEAPVAQGVPKSSGVMENLPAVHPPREADLPG